MKISSSTNTSAILFQNTQKNSAQKSDGISEGIKKQIENIKEQISDLSKNDTLSPKAKIDKRKELQDLLQDLNSQLSQRQIEIKKEALEEKVDTAENFIPNEKTHLDVREKTDTVSISDAAMKSIIGAEYTMAQITITTGVKSSLEGQDGVLAGEIALDQSRGVDTSSKSAKRSDIKGNINSISMDVAADLSEINEGVQDVTESAETDKIDSYNKNNEHENSLDPENDSDRDALVDPNNPNGTFITYDAVDIRF